MAATAAVLEPSLPLPPAALAFLYPARSIRSSNSAPVHAAPRRNVQDRACVPECEDSDEADPCARDAPGACTSSRRSGIGTE